MIRVREVIVCEGRYDKDTLSQAVDAVIIETGGFAVFNDREKLTLLRRLAAARGLIILTDSDGAGFQIRAYLKGAIDPALVKHAYIPDVPGRERRKKSASKAGTLGVEGMDPETLIAALRRAGATFEGEAAGSRPEALSGADMYALGLAGTQGSAARRAALLRAVGLPERLHGPALRDVLGALYTREELARMLERLEEGRD